MTQPGNLKNLELLRKKLNAEWAGGKGKNLDKVGEILGQAKDALTTCKFLPGTSGESSKEELRTAREILEIGAFWAVAKRDTPAFEAYMAQLKCYYLDFKNDMEESTFKTQLLGLNLLCLLSQNRVAEFHTELELVAHPDVKILENIYIKHAVSLEQYLMEGRYNKIFQAKLHVPAEPYTYFIDILLNTVREEIAGCIEKSYASLKSEDAAKALSLTLPLLQKFAERRGWKANQAGVFVFHAEKKHDEDIPSFELAKDFIEYAKELEQII